MSTERIMRYVCWVSTVYAITLTCATAAWGDDGGDKLLTRARQAWADKQYAQAAELYEQLRDEFPEHAFVRSGNAQFWLWCSLGNAGEKRREIEEIERFLREHPKHRSLGYALYFMGAAHRDLGNEAEARKAWNDLLKKYPDDSMAEHARSALGAGAASSRTHRKTTTTTLGVDFIDDARRAAAWLTAKAAKADEGLTWPQYGDAQGRAVAFYDGSSGVCLFYLNMYRLTGEKEYAGLAKRAARYLEQKAIKSHKGLCWKGEGERDGRVLPRDAAPGLYTGAAGIGYVFLCLHREFGDDKYMRLARGAAEWIVATADRKNGAIHWGDDTDIISGAAGVGQFLLEMHSATSDAKYLKCAEGAAQWLIAQAVTDGNGVKWKCTASLNRFYTGFSHGTAGIAYFLACVHERTRNRKYLEAAEAGARLLRNVAVEQNDGLKWYHYEPDHVDSFQTGWCHGPAGTGRLFLKLYDITGEKRHLEIARKGATWLMKTLDPSKDRAVFYGLSICCGAAGIGDFFLDLFLATGDEPYLAHAGRIGVHLMKRAKRDGGGCKWTNYGKPDKEGKIHYGTGHMTGAAGVGSFLLRLHAVCNNQEHRFLPFVDKPRYEKPARSEIRRERYVILTNLSSDDPYYEAAKKLARAREGKILKVDPDQWLALRRKLAACRPRYVALVLEPEDIDSNLQRRMIALSARMDSDPFCDFAFGFVTGETAEDAIGLVDRCLRVEKEGLPKSIISTGVTSGIKSYVSKGRASSDVPGFTEESIYWSCVESDPNVLEFVAKNLEKIEGNGVVVFTGCGDPESIWLFADKRNLDASKHWPFDPRKVGQDPDGKMPRILAGHLRNIDFGAAVVWSGTCHSGVLHRAFVEGDIVSTFGTVDKVTEYIIPKGRSLGLAILAAGPSAFLGPIGSNHGYACIVEMERAAATGWPLGDVMRSRYNEIILVAGGKLDVGLYEVGEPELRENPMRGGGANRTLFGDPLFSPFPGTGKTYIKQNIKSSEDGEALLVRCEVVDKTSSVFWDMFGADRRKPGRLYTVVDLPAGFGDVGSVSGSATASDGQRIELTACTWAVEKIDGKRLCHVQVNADREALAQEATVVEFKIRRRPPA